MSTKKGKYGNPRKNRPAPRLGDLLKRADPSGVADAGTLGGDMIGGTDDSHARNGVVLDMTDVVLLEEVSVSMVEVARQGAWADPLTYLLMQGRVNQSTRQVRVGFVANTDGVAALITELLAISDRAGPELLDDVTRRLIDLHQGKHVDLHWLKAAIDNAIESQEG